MSCVDRTTSPPTSSAAHGDAAVPMPRAMPRTTSTGVSPGTARDMSTAVGRAPIAWMSAKFWVTAFVPTSPGVDQSREKCWPSTRMSVVHTWRAFGAAAASTAASSPLSALGAAALIAAMVPASPTSETVRACGGTAMRCPFQGGGGGR